MTDVPKWELQQYVTALISRIWWSCLKKSIWHNSEPKVIDGQLVKKYCYHHNLISHHSVTPRNQNLHLYLSNPASSTPRRTQLDLKQESEMAPIFQQLDLDPSFVLELFEAKPAPQQRNRTPGTYSTGSALWPPS